jgi:hypothetical protein
MTNEPTQEVRFAIVLYGGVSLAIYINGVVQELLRLVRSTSGLQNLKGSEPVYQDLGRLLGPGFIPKEQLGAIDPINTKFKIDIISGASAGGINGIYLAKALATESDLSQLQELWFNEGGIDPTNGASATFSAFVSSQASATTSSPTTIHTLPSLRAARRLFPSLLSQCGFAKSTKC